MKILLGDLIEKIAEREYFQSNDLEWQTTWG